MGSEGFIQNFSIVKRLKTVMFSIAVFFVIGFFANYLSSQGFLRGLQEINNTNVILSFVAQTIEGLDTSSSGLERMNSAKDLKDIEFAFNESQSLVNKALHESIQQTHRDDRVLPMLKQGSEAIGNFEQSARNILTSYHQFTKEELEAEWLVANQFLAEAREALKNSQITLRSNSNLLFNSIYKTRFVPLIVTIVLSIFFFIFVVTYGFSLAKKIGYSISNLTVATDAVAAGDLSYEAKILEHDEFGNLTSAFNGMVNSIRSGRKELDYTFDKVRRLQGITASFSEALTVDQVCDITVKTGIEALGATAGTIGLVSADGSEIELRRWQGFAVDINSNCRKFPSSVNVPMAESIRTKNPIFVETKAELQRYSDLTSDENSSSFNSLVSLPLIVGSSCMGSVTFTFNVGRTFNQGVRDFLMAIARQSAQALHRSQLYDNAREAIQSRDDFLSIASHELKTPLTPLKLQLQMLGRQIKKGQQSFAPEKIASIVDSSDRQLVRLSKLIEDLLDVSRITSGKLTLNFEKVDIDLMVQEVLTQYEHQLKHALKKVEYDSSGTMIAEVDKIRLEQVLINLLTNAAKYAPGKPIKVTLDNNGETAKICVQDQGPGIAPENLRRIFDRFERVRDTDNIGGLGLGLYISKQIIQAHNGDIYVDSKLGEGSTFVVKIPLRPISKIG
ncbi:MAG TPA: ATP-binding protein [Bacteriovoracaceae bacterium]|nr:ATP-binding protein [Bacteriovoracaceae bacterium]